MSRWSRINELRDLSICVLEKVPGEENLADGFTKLLGRNMFRVFVDSGLAWP